MQPCIDFGCISLLILIDTASVPLVRFDLKDLEKNFNKTEDDIKALQSVGQIIGEVLKQLDEERCEYHYDTEGSKAPY